MSDGWSARRRRTAATLPHMTVQPSGRASRLAATVTQPERLVLVLVVDLPPGGEAAFWRYEDAVLPLLVRHGGRLERRLRTPDARTEVHVVSFADEDGHRSYVADPERQGPRTLLDRFEPVQRSLRVEDVPLPPP